MSGRVYLDHNATTPLDPIVIEAVVASLREGFGNPSSLHSFGQAARAALDAAREEVAALVGGAPAEIVFTASGTEADDLAVRGAAQRLRPERRRLLCSAIEHHAVLNTVRSLGRQGWPAATVAVGHDGRIDLEDLARQLDAGAGLLSLMLANNETGVLQPVAQAAELARRHGALVHCDAVQAAGKVALDVRELGVDLLSVSAHKLHGPKGAAALWVRRGTPMEAVIHGGAQERNRRAGTENVPGLVGFGVAARLARERLGEARAIAARRDRLEAALLSRPGTERNGGEPRVPNTTSLSFGGLEGEALVIALDLEGVAASTGAACAAGGVEPSHVLRAMGLPPERVESAVRFSLGHETTDAEVDAAVAAVGRCVERQRARRPVRAPS